uniref:Uncharacterized protein n=1 Tax=Avena sativa TaxID=4498 RepID=A0ACD5V5J6_AVESA
MKVQCDVCAAQAASVFCCADEAALCDECDRRVHCANKLAGKHRRLSLLHPSTSSSDSSSSSSSAQKPPPCDICQEKRGFLFCKEDRAILCRECDVRVHTTSDLTRRHSRFLLTGVRVSSAPVESPAPSDQEEARQEVEEENGSSPCNADSCSGAASATPSASDGSSISEYLTKTLPGWHVEDFLLDDAAASAAVAVSSDEPYQGGMAAIGGLHDGYPAWAGAGREQVIGDVVIAAAGERARRELWVPQMQVDAEWAGSKRPRASSSYYSCW